MYNVHQKHDIQQMKDSKCRTLRTVATILQMIVDRTCEMYTVKQLLDDGGQEMQAIDARTVCICRGCVRWQYRPINIQKVTSWPPQWRKNIWEETAEEDREHIYNNSRSRRLPGRIPILYIYRIQQYSILVHIL